MLLIIKLIIGIFLNVVLSLLSYIIPKDKDMIICGSHKTFAGNSKAFFLYLHKYSNKKVYWITSEKFIYKMLNEKNLPVLYLYSFKAFTSILRANYLILTHGIIDVSYFYLLYGRFNLIQTWHGIALKDISFTAEDKAPLLFKTINRISRKADRLYKLIIATSEESKKIFISAFRNTNVKILGYTRNDVFYNKDLIFEDYRVKLSLYKFNKVILYAPTFRENPTLVPFSHKFLNRLNNYLVEKNHILLIKNHPYEKPIESTYSNILNISKNIIDIQDLLIHVDILITDYSSIMFDFVLLDKPIIFYAYDLKEYTEKCRGLYYDYYKELPGPFARNEDELLDIIANIDSIFNDKIYMERYKAFKDKFNYYKDGNSCLRLYRELYNSI